MKWFTDIIQSGRKCDSCTSHWKGKLLFQLPVLTNPVSKYSRPNLYRQLNSAVFDLYSCVPVLKQNKGHSQNKAATMSPDSRGDWKCRITDTIMKD